MADKKICPILKYHLSASHLDFIPILNMTYPAKDKDCPHSKKSYGGHDDNNNTFGVGGGGILAVIVIIIIIIIIIALIAWAAGGWNKGRQCGSGGSGGWGSGGY